MLHRVIARRTWTYIGFLVPTLGLALVAGQASVAGTLPVGTLAGGSSDRPAQASGVSGGKAAHDAPLSDAFLFLAPGTGGSVPAPPNGGSVPLGGRFVLDLMLNSGSSNTSAQQSYLTFTNSILRNASVSVINSACTLTGTVTEDLSIFDTALQNE